MLQYRVGVFFGGATLAGAFSGLLAFGISFMSGTAGMLGWSWIFVSRACEIFQTAENLQAEPHRLLRVWRLLSLG